MITCKAAKKLLSKAGHEVKDIQLIPEGSNHKVFIVTTKDNVKMICKFPTQRYTENNMSIANVDTLYGGELSLKREASLYTLAREKGYVPTPKVYVLCNIDGFEFILLEMMSGVSFREYVHNNNYSLDKFLNSLELLGADFAGIQSITFESYGDIMSQDKISPSNLTNFADRFSKIIKRRIDKANKKGVFTSHELELVTNFFFRRLEEFHPYLSIDKKPPVMVFTDMHADNYFVDESGKPSGYFDLESSQAAPAELEFYGLKFFLFNYFDEDTMCKAEKAFYKGYISSGGKYAPKDEIDNTLIDFLSGCRLLELTESYWGYIDGLRDLWGYKMKAILLNYILYGKVDYIAISNIYREKTKQPCSPLR